MIKVFKILLAVLVVTSGALFFVAAGVDDSPGGQLLGAVIVISGIVAIVRSRRKVSKVKE